MKTKVLFSLVFLFLLGIGAYNFLYKSHRDFATEETLSINSVTDFLKLFNENETEANKKYLNKVIESNGIITDVDLKNKSITIDEVIFASFDETNMLTFKINSKIHYKGRFIGYDELLEEIKLDNCTIIN